MSSMAMDGKFGGGIRGCNNTGMTTPEKLKAREKVVDRIRDFFKGEGFIEVQTPILVPVPSAEPNLEVFKTLLRSASSGRASPAYLIMSPEYSLKKLIAQGAGNIFEITKAFRNEEEVSAWHNPEFTILEWYRINANYKKIMEDFEKMFVKIIGGEELNYQGVKYDLRMPWPKYSCEELGLLGLPEPEFNLKFYNEVEPLRRAQGKPFFVYDYPVDQASLARKKTGDSRVAERFEVFLAGVELGNAFSELTDPGEQRRRFQEELRLRKAQHKTPYPMDEELLKALEKMPETAGIAVGVDRLVMLATDAASVGETMTFPAQEIFGL